MSQIAWGTCKLEKCPVVRQGSSFRYKTAYLKRLPIVQPNPQQQAILESITDDSRMAELNAVVYQMYGLTADEIALVEAHTAGAALQPDTDADLLLDDE